MNMGYAKSSKGTQIVSVIAYTAKLKIITSENTGDYLKEIMLII